MAVLLQRIRRILSKSPLYILKRLGQEVRFRTDRFIVPRYTTNWTQQDWLKELDLDNIQNPFSFLSLSPTLEDSEAKRIFAESSRAAAHVISLLGAEDIELGQCIDWSRDYKTGDRWPLGYAKFIDYMNPERASDVKTVWELSRMQWLLPCGQAFLLDKDEVHPQVAREVIESWCKENPFAFSVNWACTMEPAMRLFALLWLMHAFAESKSWQEDEFCLLLNKLLYQHGWYVDRFFEMSDVNGNHCTADAAALVVIGIYFRHKKFGRKWLDRGWAILQDEIFKQVTQDGVDYEASIPYHRLCTELFFIPALCLDQAGGVVPQSYKDRVLSMADFVQHYMKPDLTSPLLGDADDARTLPLGSQGLLNHHYIADLIKIHWGGGNSYHESSMSELVWWLPNLERFESKDTKCGQSSKLFQDGCGGYAVLQKENIHIFMDAAPIGLAGRGGHGHNDCLHIDLFMHGETILSDSGSYVYTADYDARNEYRKTHMHNTPYLEGEEINRFIGRDFLWNLYYDAEPKIIGFDGVEALMIASHSAYNRLGLGEVTRSVQIKEERYVVISDQLPQLKDHNWHVDYVLGANVKAEQVSDNEVLLKLPNKKTILFQCDGWRVSEITKFAIAPSYGVLSSSSRVRLVAEYGHQQFQIKIFSQEI